MQINVDKLIPKAMIKKYGIHKCRAAVKASILEMLSELDYESCIEQTLGREEDE